jgi:Na+/H+ antiporter NhaD/arsenite permease-like protein
MIISYNLYICRNTIVGKRPFDNAFSIAAISAFVLISSQLLGNVAVVQLARPNITDLDNRQKELAWAVISFVATVGGNLTITGSAGMVIVFNILAFIS